MCTVHGALGTEHHQELTTNGPRVGQGTLARKDLARTRGARRPPDNPRQLNPPHALPDPHAAGTSDKMCSRRPRRDPSNSGPGGSVGQGSPSNIRSYRRNGGTSWRTCCGVLSACSNSGSPPSSAKRPWCSSEAPGPCAQHLAPAAPDTAAPARSRSLASLDQPIT